MRTATVFAAMLVLGTAMAMKLGSGQVDTVAMGADTAGLILASIVWFGSRSVRLPALMLLSGLFLAFFLIGLRQHLRGENAGASVRWTSLRSSYSR